jgi:hypothetical protein
MTDETSTSQGPAVGQATRTLLQRIKSRQRMVSVGQRFYLALMICAALFAMVLLVSRLLGIIPDVFSLLSLLVVPVVAFMAGLIFHRRYNEVDAARAADERAATRDLFLTSTLIDKSPGAYKEIVLSDAEKRAADVEPEKVVPFQWVPPARNSALILVLLALGILFLPQLDPFKQGEARAKTEEAKKELEKIKKVREARKAQLERADIDKKHSQEIDDAMKKLKNSFNTMKPNERQENFKRLTENQQELGKQWKEKSDKLLKDALEKNPSNQQFGMQSEKAQEWKKELMDGKVEKMLGEVDRLKNLARQISQTEDGEKKKQMEKELKESIKELSEFARKEMNSNQLNSALNKALEQLNMANLGSQMSPEAMKEIVEQMELAGMEMKDKAQTKRDIEELEKALDALAKAQQCNNAGEKGLDGGQCQNPGQTPGKGEGEGQGQGQGQGEEGMTMEEYQAFYEQMLAQSEGQGEGEGQGQGMKGPGTGKGGEAPEDPTKKTNYQTERTKTALQAGRILMKWDAKEKAEKGAIREDYLDQVHEVQQGVSEAIVQEQIPPGYHESIQNYFDSLQPEVLDVPAGAQPVEDTTGATE